MDKDERKPRLHVHLGGLIILIIILLVLFKVDIRSKIKSPQFQANISYIEDQAKTIWQKYISGPLRIKAKDFFIEKTNEGVKKWQDDFTNNVLKTPNDKEIDNLINNKN